MSLSKRQGTSELWPNRYQFLAIVAETTDRVTNHSVEIAPVEVGRNLAGMKTGKPSNNANRTSKLPTEKLILRFIALSDLDVSLTICKLLRMLTFKNKLVPVNTLKLEIEERAILPTCY